MHAYCRHKHIAGMLNSDNYNMVAKLLQTVQSAPKCPVVHLKSDVQNIPGIYIFTTFLTYSRSLDLKF